MIAPLTTAFMALSAILMVGDFELASVIVGGVGVANQALVSWAIGTEAA